jgi:hypothetical protein
MRTILVILTATCLLAGCEVLGFEGAAVEGAGLAGAAGEVGLAEGAGGMAIAGAGADGAASLAISGEFEGLAAERGVLSNWLADFARSGRYAELEPGGILRANGSPLGHIEAEDGVIWSRTGNRVGYLSKVDGAIYEYTPGGSRALGVLDGFTAENGVELTPNVDGTTAVEILRPRVMVRVLEIENGRYLIQLPNGTTGWIGAGTLSLMILALDQQQQDCPDNAPGALLRTSGEEIPFARCQHVDGAYILDTDKGVIVVDAADVSTIMIGDRVPGVAQMANVDLPPLPAAAAQPDSNEAAADDAGDGQAATVQSGQASDYSSASGTDFARDIESASDQPAKAPSR